MLHPRRQVGEETMLHQDHRQRRVAVLRLDIRRIAPEELAACLHQIGDSRQQRLEEQPGVVDILDPTDRTHVDEAAVDHGVLHLQAMRSEEHTSELQSLMRISYAVFCLKKKRKRNNRQKKITERNK